MLEKIYNSLLTLAYPQSCDICQNSVENFSDGGVCRPCWQKTRIFSGAEVLCGKCGAYLREAKNPVSAFCHACDEHFYHAAKAVGLYEKALAASVIRLKREPFVCRNLRELFLCAFEKSDFQNASLIIPVPLSRRRLLERGFNQAALLSRVLSKRTGIETDEKTLVREIHTPVHRAAMDKKARAATVKNAFAVTRKNFVENKRILLVDDVFTSGATASACAEILKKNGAAEVYVLTAARAN